MTDSILLEEDIILNFGSRWFSGDGRQFKDEAPHIKELEKVLLETNSLEYREEISIFEISMNYDDFVLEEYKTQLDRTYSVHDYTLADVIEDLQEILTNDYAQETAIFKKVL